MLQPKRIKLIIIYKPYICQQKTIKKQDNLKNTFTTAWSRESANAFDDETSKCRPTAAAVRSKGSSISLVGVGWRLHTRTNK